MMFRISLVLLLFIGFINCLVFQPSGVTHPLRNGTFPAKLESFNKKVTFRTQTGIYQQLAMSDSVVWMVQSKTLATLYDDAVRYAIPSSSVMAVDIATSKQLWNQTLPGDDSFCNHAPLITPSSIVMMCDHLVHALNPKTGSIVSTLEFGVMDAVSTANGLFVVGRHSTSAVLLLDAELHVMASLNVTRDEYSGVAALNESVVFVISSVPSPEVECFDVVANKRLWSTVSDNPLQKIAIDTENNVVVAYGHAESQAFITAIDSSTGSVKWSKSVPSAQGVLLDTVALFKGFVAFTTNRKIGSDTYSYLNVMDIQTGDQKSEQLMFKDPNGRGFAFYSSSMDRLIGMDQDRLYIVKVDTQGKIVIENLVTKTEIGYADTFAFNAKGDFATMALKATRQSGGKMLHEFVPLLFSCGPNFADVACTTCQQGYFFLKASCAQCPTFNVIVAALGAGLVFVVVIVLSVRKAQERQQPEKVGQEMTVEHAKALNNQDEDDPEEVTNSDVLSNSSFRMQLLMPLIQFVHFAQLISLVNRLHVSLEWPSFVTPVIEFLDFFNLDIDSMGIQCELPEGSGAKQALFVLSPLCWNGFLLIGFFVMRWKRVSAGKQALVIRILIQSIRMSFLNLCVRAFIMFDCSSDIGGLKLRDDPRVICFSSAEWGTIAVWSCIAFVFLCLLPGYGYVYILRRFRAENRTKFEEEAFGFLFSDFRMPAAMFEGFILVRKLQATLLVMLMDSMPTHIKYSMFSTNVIVALGVAFWKPFRRRRRNVLEVVLSVAGGVVFVVSAATGGEAEATGTIIFVCVLIGFVASLVVFALDVIESRKESSMSETELLSLEESDDLGLPIHESMDEEDDEKYTRWMIGVGVVAGCVMVLMWIAVILRKDPSLPEGTWIGIQGSTSTTWAIPFFTSFLCFLREGKLINMGKISSKDILHTGMMGGVACITFYIEAVKMVTFMTTEVTNDLLYGLAAASMIFQIVFVWFQYQRWMNISKIAWK